MKQQKDETVLNKVNGIHTILSRLDTKATIMVSILSILITVMCSVGVDIFNDKLIVGLVFSSISLFLLIIAPWLVGFKNNSKYNIWNNNFSDDRESDVAFKNKLAFILKVKSVLFWIAILCMVVSMILIIKEI